MKFKANFVEKPGNFQMDDCQIEKVVELSHEDFCRLKIAPWRISRSLRRTRTVCSAGTV